MLGSSLSQKTMSSSETKKPKTTNEKTQPKYLMAISTNDQKPLASLNPFKLAKLLDTAAKLEPIANQALRLCLGAFRTSPILPVYRYFVTNLR